MTIVMRWNSPATSAKLPQIVQLGSEVLLSARVVFQPGVRYQHADWTIDELMTMYLTDSAPDTFVLQPAQTCIEVRGARRMSWIDRIEPATFAFRTALLDGLPIGDAAEAALDRDPAFDAGEALTAAGANVPRLQTTCRTRDITAPRNS
jgi:hypothetical protein